MINLALIGVGAWGKNYISTLKSFTDCRIKYLCAESTKSLNFYGDDYIKVTDYKELFSFPDIDGVIIATPNSTHYEIAQAFLSKNYPVLIEKPFIENYSQGLKLKSKLKNNEFKGIVGHTYLFDPAYKKAKELVKNIGPIRYISYEGTNNGPYRQGTSALWDIGPHAVSLCMDINQKEPEYVSAWAMDTLRPGNDFYDFSIIKLRFFDQTEAFIKISWLFPMKKRELVIIGRTSGIVYDAVAEKKVSYYENMIPRDITKKNDNSEISYPTYGSISPLEAEIGEFVAVIMNKSKNKYSNLDFGIKITQVLNLAEESIKTNAKPIKIL